MCRVSWISLCVIMVSAAIPLTERDGEEVAHDSNAFKEEEHDEVVKKEWINDDHSEIFPSKGGKDNNKQVPYNQTNIQQEIPKDDVLALINRSNNFTAKLHSDIRKIYHIYTQAHQSGKNINVIPSVWHYLRKNLPSKENLNKAASTNKMHTTKTTQLTADVNSKVSSDHDSGLKNNKSHKNGQKQIQHGSEYGDVEVNNETEARENRSNTVFTLSNNTDNLTTGEENIIMQPESSCQHVPGFYQPRWLQMVVLCPTHWTEPSTKTQCESWESLNTLTFMDQMTFLPVQDVSGAVYGNVYCAICHGVSLFLPWKTSFLCDKDSSMTFHMGEFSDLNLLYSYLPTSKCERLIIPSIPDKLHDCEKDTHQISWNTRENDGVTTNSMPSSYPVSFNVLMNFDFTGHAHILFTASQQYIEDEYIPRCQEGKTFDPYAHSCRNLSCSRSYTLVGNKCIRTGNEPLNSESITDLSQLRTVNLVSLQVNITYGDYLITKIKALEPDIVLQIADHLDISVERLKDVNVTYELGSINGTALEVNTLTEDQYWNLFPQNHSQTGTSSSKQDGADFWKANSFSNGEEQPKADKGHDGLNSTKDSVDTTLISYQVEHARKTKPSLMTLKSKMTAQQKAIDTEDNDEDLPKDGRELNNKQEQVKRNMKKRMENVEYPSDEKTDMMKYFLLFNLSSHTLLNNKKLFQHVFRHRETLVNESFFPYHLKSHDNSSELYVSVPVNDQKDRICLLIKDSHNLELLLKRDMIMRISFVLVPPDDPLSTEQGSDTLLQKIDHLIYEQQFTLKLNGNNVDVVGVQDDRDMTIDEEFCPWGVDYIVYNDEFMMVTMDNETLMYVNLTNSFVGVGLFDLYVLVSGSNSAEETNFTDMMRYAFVCFMPRIIDNDCDQINLPKDEYYVAGQNKSIIFEGKEYDVFEYQVIDQNTGTIQICVPPNFNNQDRTLLPHLVTIDNGCSTDFDGALKAEGYVTLVLGRASMFALSCVILTYLLFPALRNLPGLNTMNLTICLFVTQIIFAEGIGEDRHWLCTTVAISLHYFLLAAHFWMNVTSYDVYKTFTNPTITSHVREKSKYFRRYALYAWGAPFIIVSLCVFVDFSKLFDGISIGYWDSSSSSTTDVSSENENSNNTVHDGMAKSSNKSVTEQHMIHSCWITQPLAALVSFGDIIMLIFLVNCIFFGKTIRSISKTAKITKKSLTTRHSNSSLNKMTDRSEVMLYVRMSTVMGFTWVFGISSSILSTFVKPPTFTACAVIHLLAILFIILNTSQGIFIFVAFVCNRRVFGLYKDLILRAKMLLSQSRRASIFSISPIISSNKQTQ